MGDDFDTVLMIGATGMLAEAALWAASRSERLVLVSRGAIESSLSNCDHVAHVSADWRDADGSMQAIKDAGGFARVSHAVLWMHTSGAEAKGRVLERLAQTQCLVVDVVGSAALQEISAP